MKLRPVRARKNLRRAGKLEERGELLVKRNKIVQMNKETKQKSAKIHQNNKNG